MGVIKQGILGGFSGKVANIIGSSWKGIAYMKAMPLSVANPRTAKQVAHRNKFSNVVEFATKILSNLIKPLNDRFAVKMSGYNLFVQRNIELFEGVTAVPASGLVLASGKIAKTPVTAIDTATLANVAKVDFDKALTDDYQQATDLAYLLAVDSTQNRIAVSAAEQTRSEEHTSELQSH